MGSGNIEPQVSIPISSFHNVDADEQGNYHIAVELDLCVTEQQVHDLLTTGLRGFLFLEPAEEELSLLMKAHLESGKLIKPRKAAGSQDQQP